MKELAKILGGKGGVLAVLVVLLLAAVPAAAQKKDKKKQQSPSELAPDPKNLPPVSDTQAVDLVIGQSLGYWQIGDLDSLHKYYADDVVVVTGDWSPDMASVGLATLITIVGLLAQLAALPVRLVEPAAIPSSPNTRSPRAM